MIKRFVWVLAGAAILMGAGGCASTGESAQRDTLTEHVGNYPPAPSGIPSVRVGVPPFKVETGQGMGGGGDKLNNLAADQMNTLLYKSHRFQVVERTQLQKLLNEQNMEGIVKAGELAKPGRVRGVDYLLIGRVTNLRVKKDQTHTNLDTGGVGGVFSTFGMDKKNTKITTECGVDIRLVDPTSGEVRVAENSEYKRTDTADAMGIAILGSRAEADASIEISEDDKGKILRLALDDALRKALPDIDQFLISMPRPAAPAAPAATPAPATPSAETPAAPASAEKKFCPHCGKPITAGAKFCPSCGEKTGG